MRIIHTNERNGYMAANGLLPADFLLPSGVDMSKWSVIACDQFTSDRDYWARVEKTVGNDPSTLHAILPEVYLGDPDVQFRIERLQAAMSEYLRMDLFRPYHGYVYVERTLNNGVIRRGIVGLIDLEDYSYESRSESPIRSTEQTVLERIPPRLNIRKNSPLEIPHVIMLFDDPCDTVMSAIDTRKDSYELLYDFELMENGGHITGWLLDRDEQCRIRKAFSSLAQSRPMAFAVGDGNHSLAAAKSSYELLKKDMPVEEYLVHPARYALVEAVNLHDPAMQFEPIHRIIFDVDTDDLLNSMEKFFDRTPGFDSGDSPVCCLSFKYIKGGKAGEITVRTPHHTLPVAALQDFLDHYLSSVGGKIDYIHGEETLKALAANPGSIGFLLPPIDKSTLFDDVIRNGAFPRKTFSCGNAEDKRYYLECRRIVP